MSAKNQYHDCIINVKKCVNKNINWKYHAIIFEVYILHMYANTFFFSSVYFKSIFNWVSGMYSTQVYLTSWQYQLVNSIRHKLVGEISTIIHHSLSR